MVRVLLVIGAILILLFAALFLAQIGFFKENKEALQFEIVDECAVVLGNLIHSINDEGECRLRCINNCEIRDMKFDQFNFTEKEDSCHTCSCYCR